MSAVFTISHGYSNPNYSSQFSRSAASIYFASCNVRLQRSCCASAHLVHFGGKKAPQAFAYKNVNFFLFNCELERIDHGDLKGSNFEGDDNRK